MTWIAFDNQTRNAVGEMLGAPVKLAPRTDDPLDYALASERSSVIIAPFAGSEQLAVVTVKKNLRKEPAPVAPPKQPTTRTSHYVTSGFLGLSDEVEVEEEPEQRKSWWKKLFS